MVFDVTWNEVVPAGADTFWFDGVTVSVALVPAWVTVTVTGVTPPALTVMVAMRLEVVVFAS